MLNDNFILKQPLVNSSDGIVSAPLKDSRSQSIHRLLIRPKSFLNLFSTIYDRSSFRTALEKVRDFRASVFCLTTLIANLLQYFSELGIAIFYKLTQNPGRNKQSILFDKAFIELFYRR